jgi:hypothetical protein
MTKRVKVTPTRRRKAKRARRARRAQRRNRAVVLIG